MDARQLAFPDSSFDAVVMHLILASCRNRNAGVREAVPVLKPGGRTAVFDKFLKDEEHPSLKRQLLNAIAHPLFSDLNRRPGPLITRTPLVIEHERASRVWRDVWRGDPREARRVTRRSANASNRVLSCGLPLSPQTTPQTEAFMSWAVVNLHRIMILSGLLTMTMIYAALAPEGALRSMFGENVSGPVADIVVRNWERRLRWLDSC
jgi:SAM-dependent methyltransferase